MDQERFWTRRKFLRGAALLGCSAAAHPLMTTVTLAGSDGGHPLGDQRLIVVILRGAMDGLDVVRPMGDASYLGYRPTILKGAPGADLDGFFALHPSLAGLMPLWAAGELAFVHAASTPYRDKRSHFDGQNLLEAGTGLDVPAGRVKDGWLNRLLQVTPGVQAETAYAVGQEAEPLLAGLAPVRNWAPDTRLTLSPQAELLLEHIYHDDPLFQGAAVEAIELTSGAKDIAPAETMAADGMAGADAGVAIRLNSVAALADFAAGRLREETRIAAFSLSGWDTHRSQEGTINKSLARLERVILQMRDSLGPEVWGKTTLMAMTEFGRTARENGSAGTDHGTAGAIVMAGGAIKGGRVYGRWPGLGEGDLFEERDLLPTSDVREWAAWAMRGLYGIDQGVLERVIFPGLQMGDDPRLIL
jgi:uncharacterized protein (DUF1501 family)